MIGADTSFLVGLAVREHPSHAACWALFERDIMGQPGSLALAPQVLAEFAHVVTDPRRFEHPLDMAAALEMCEQWWNAVECRPVAVDAEAGIQFLAWMREHRLGCKRFLDTLLAACYHRAGVARIATQSLARFRALR